jgi:hypothetical protein
MYSKILSSSDSLALYGKGFKDRESKKWRQQGDSLEKKKSENK